MFKRKWLYCVITREITEGVIVIPFFTYNDSGGLENGGFICIQGRSFSYMRGRHLTKAAKCSRSFNPI